MKKIYEQPQAEVFEIRITHLCDPSPIWSDDPAQSGGEGGGMNARRRTFLDGVDEVDWDLGF